MSESTRRPRSEGGDERVESNRASEPGKSASVRGPESGSPSSEGGAARASGGSRKSEGGRGRAGPREQSAPKASRRRWAARTPLWIEGGTSALFVGALLFLGHLSNLGTDRGPGSVTGLSLLFAAHTLAVIAIAGLQAKQERVSGLLGLVGRLGAVIAIVGTVAVSAVIFVQLAQATGVDVGAVLAAPAASEIAAFGPLFFVFGLLLFGAVTVRGGVLPPSGGVALIAGTIIFAAGTLSIGMAPYVELVGSAVTGFGFLRLGVFLLAPHREAS